MSYGILLLGITNKWILVVVCGIESLLNGLRTGPTDEIKVGASLVVGAAGAGAAKRLLTYHSPSRLVVIVDIASGIPKDVTA